ncbi:MFS transporter [Acidocella sp. KAb 2-4]|uniref:MFS transporter n=1 Tax=Acidocella sp. KAb 2-4 TaxID=2885158 RepID=UPI001D079938|nr:MFS transporter [Acidocella sp. KAb 2-4]MCB5944516.1 MFS transporter [Acidocella sp. KAb 2-4]
MRDLHAGMIFRWPTALAPAAAVQDNIEPTGEVNFRMENGRERRKALTFIVLIGCVSLFADMTYEGGRSVAGPFLAVLGAPAVAVATVAGFGEFLGYSVRYLSGRAADRSGRYWLLMGMGYVVNLLSVPMLALVNSWPLAAALLIAERTGRAVRAPIRGAMLSHAATRTGVGWGFGLHTALDQTGGMSGPLLVALLIGAGSGFHHAFALLALPALASLALLAAARQRYPDPRKLELEVGEADISAWSGFGPPFRRLTIAAALVAAGFADFALIGFHFAKAHTVPLPWIPALYAVAMAADGVFALALGRLLDRFGMAIAMLGVSFATLAVPLVFLGGAGLAVGGVLLWGMGMATQDTIFQAILSSFVAPAQRATAYGLFDAIRGTAWLAGSVVLGMLYAISLPLLVALSVAVQVAALPVLWRALPRGRA